MGPFAPLPGLPTFQLAEAPELVGSREVALEPATRGADQEEEGLPEERPGGSRLKSKSGPPPLAADTAARARALARWVEISREIRPGLAKKVDHELSIQEVMETKATATLLTRASSWTLYLNWCRASRVKPVPLTEETVNAYLRYAAVVAPTRGQKFLEAAGLAGYHLSLDVDHIFTPRARGIAAGGLKRKRETVKMKCFLASTVTRWEQLLDKEAACNDLSDKQLAIGVVRGFFLWLVHARMRFSDAARLTLEPYLDLDEKGEGYLESRASPGQYKTGHATKKLGHLLPCVASASGLAGGTWARSWLSLRRRAGLHAERDGSLMPEVLAGWAFGAGRLKVDSAAVLLRQHLLVKHDGVPGEYGTHSAKATLLSWMAKAGVKRSLRKLSGYHADGRDQSMLEYSRDAVAEPMRELLRVLSLGRGGAFNPDVTRSGRWTGTKPEELVEEVASNATASGSETTQDDNED